MTNPKKIPLDHVLVATDLEPTSLEAVREGDRWARATGSALSFVTIVTLGDSVADGTPAEADARRKADAEAFIRDATGREPSEYTLYVDRGFPVESIAARAKEIGADLVVVGTHDRGPVKRFLLGSVAQKVLRDAHCPVLLARPAPADGTVLAACQLDELTPDVVRWAAELADGDRLVLLHTEQLGVSDVAMVASALFSGTVPPTHTKETIDSILAMAKGALEAQLAEISQPGEVEVVEGHAASLIVARAKALGASLIVLGSHGKKGLTRLALGSVAEAVARDATTSVLVLR